MAGMTSNIDFLRSNLRWLSAGMLMTFLSSFGQTFFISVFAGDIRAEFGLSHGAWGGLYALGTFSSAVVLIWAGVATDHFRVRQLGAIVLIGLATACVALALNRSAWLLVPSVFLLRFFGQGMSIHIATVAMSRWFVATRGRALAIAGLGFAVGEAILPLIFVSLMAAGAYWRDLLLVCAGITMLGVPLILMVLKQERSPQSFAEASSAAGMMGRHWTRIEALRHPLFWFMVPSILGPSAFVTSFFFHQVHFAATKGWTHLEFVAWFPVFTGCCIVAMLAAGWALDMWGTSRIMPLFQLPIAVGFVFFATGTSPQMAFFGFVFIAMTVGANATLPSAFWAEFYGTAHIGSLKAMVAAVMVLGSAIGPGVTGWLIDIGIGLETQFLGIAVLFVISSVSVWIGIRRARPSLVPI